MSARKQAAQYRAKAVAKRTATKAAQADRMGKKLPGTAAKKAAVKKAAEAGTLRGNAGRKPAPKLRKQSNSDKKSR
jgi:hypothetical protein